MNHKQLPLRDERITSMPDPALAEMLFAALNDHEQTLAQVSRLLHDDVSQVLSAAGLQLDALKMDFCEAAPGVDGRVIEIQGMLEQAIDRLRSISHELNPSVAERAGLHFALDQLVEEARQTFTGAVRLHFDSHARVAPAQAKTLYKIAECAIESAIARSGCTLIDIHVKQSQGNVVLEIGDNGEFQDGQSSAKPLGVLLIEYHASNSNFGLTRNSAPGKGNTLRITCPIPAAPTG